MVEGRESAMNGFWRRCSNDLRCRSIVLGAVGIFILALTGILTLFIMETTVL